MIIYQSIQAQTVSQGGIFSQFPLLFYREDK